MNASASGEPAGWFGKLACVGDFASRRLAPAFTQACDAWLSGCLEASRAVLGERWLDAYLTSPLYRFAWAPGVVDPQWWFGAMMPSVDNVGRYYPLLIAQAAGAPPAAGADLDRLERWYAQLVEAALVTLQPGANVEGFEALLAQAGALPEPSTAPRPRRGAVAGSHEPRPAHGQHARARPCGLRRAGDAAPLSRLLDVVAAACRRRRRASQRRGRAAGRRIVCADARGRVVSCGPRVRGGA